MRKMKDSGVEWIGDVNVAVDLVPLKYLLSNEKAPIKVGPFGSQLSGTDFLFDESDYWVYNQRMVIDNNYEMGEAFISKEKYDAMQGFHVKSNDILITTRGTIGKISRIPPKHAKGIFHPCIIRFRINDDKIRYDLLRLIFNESDFIARQISYKSNATTIDVIYSDTLRNLIIPIWSPQLQKIISDYLCIKCKQIDNLIADIQSQIDILEQYKRSVITEAVTKGLDPNVEMKDSQVEWVGAIPAEWEIHPLYCYFGERKRINTLGKEDNLLSLSYGKVIQKDINTLGGLLPESFNTYNIVEPNDIIIRPTDLQNDKRSLRTGLCTQHGIITAAYIALKPIVKLNSAFFHYLLYSFDVAKVFYNMGNGVRQGLNFGEFSKLTVFFPSLQEQDKIAAYLDRKCSEIDCIIKDKKQQLETLAEYKKSLIYEYVTGKKGVI